MLDDLIDSPALLAGAIAVVSLLNYGVNLWILRAHRRQPFVEYWRPPADPGKARSDAAQLAVSLSLSAVAIVLTLLLARFGRELVGGGVFVMQVITLGSNVSDLLAVRSLGRSDAAEGHLRYSTGYRYRAGAARMAGASIVAGIVAVLFDSRPFLMGAVFLLATAVGWYRRARQAAVAARPV
ncbi:MAG TPA: hypothetical protein VN654_19795 [Vicinamibacterales bacterium]|jgi:hypothetical protein|nr:hypothetical protein [Vicinamibacterales bacterium]